MTNEERYLHLRGRLTNILCPEDKLNILKEHFKILIDSDRRYDRIRTFLDLIRILERRDVISPYNINPVNYIANVLQNNEIIELINGFHAPPQVEPVRQNDAAQAQPIRRDVAFANNNIGRVLPTIDPDRINRVYDVICMEIGQNWKNFARALKISEGIIDQLGYKHMSNISEMVREVITYHKAKCDPVYWECELLNALIDARRRDLNIEVHKILCYA